MTRFGSPHRPDANAEEIVEGLRKFGIAVKSLGAVGNGVPDLLVAYRGVTVLLEVKTEAGKLRASQIEFLASWPGKAYVVSSPEEAVRVVVEAARPCDCVSGKEK